MVTAARKVWRRLIWRTRRREIRWGRMIACLMRTCDARVSFSLLTAATRTINSTTSTRSIWRLKWTWVARLTKPTSLTLQSRAAAISTHGPICRKEYYAVAWRWLGKRKIRIELRAQQARGIVTWKWLLEAREISKVTVVMLSLTCPRSQGWALLAWSRAVIKRVLTTRVPLASRSVSMNSSTLPQVIAITCSLRKIFPTLAKEAVLRPQVSPTWTQPALKDLVIVRARPLWRAATRIERNTRSIAARWCVKVSMITRKTSWMWSIN